MSGATQPQYPERRVWVNPSSSAQWLTKRLTKNSRKKPQQIAESFCAAEEVADFHDPYSELSLFLSQKIKLEMRTQGWLKKWTLKIQEALLRTLAPEFQKKFPKYRLGVAALRTTWEKLAYYTDQFEKNQDAIGSDGRLNISYLIRANLKQYPQLSTISCLHPYQYAHQLAAKISECIAIVDGIKPPIDQLSRTIWAMQRHLIDWSSLQSAKSPYDEYDSLDRAIVKMILEFVPYREVIPAISLEEKVEESLQSMSEYQLPNIVERVSSSSEQDSTVYLDLLEEVPLSLRIYIENEIAIQLIDHPDYSYEQIIVQAWNLVKKSLESIAKKKEVEIREKIVLWCQQGDLVCRCVIFDRNTPLLKRILDRYKELEKCDPQLNTEAFAKEIYNQYIDEYPELHRYKSILWKRLLLMCKYTWYTIASGPEETAIDRYLKWHGISANHPHIENYQKALPLIPFSSTPDKPQK
jgi:hypothetical protein